MASKASSKAAPKKTAAKAPAKKAAPKAAKPAVAEAAVAPVAASGAIGFFDVATVERKPWGILALLFNIIPGGVGTIIAGAKHGSMSQIVKGILQFVFVWTVLMWIWSVIDGVRMFRRSA